MRDLTLRRGATAQGATTITIHGDEFENNIKAAVVRNITLTNSVIEDGNVSIMDGQGVTLSRLNLRSLPRFAHAPVLARNRIQNLRILDSVIERVTGSGPGNAIKISSQPGAGSVDALLSGVRVVQATTDALVRTEQLARLVIVGMELVYTGPAQDEHAVVVVGNPAQPAEAPVLVDTTVQGQLAGAARVAGRFNGQPVLVRVTGP